LRKGLSEVQQRERIESKLVTPALSATQIPPLRLLFLFPFWPCLPSVVVLSEEQNKPMVVFGDKLIDGISESIQTCVNVAKLKDTLDDCFGDDSIWQSKETWLIGKGQRSETISGNRFLGC